MEVVTRGISNKNPFNIRISSNSWKGKISNYKNTDKVFEQFIDIDYGLRAGIQLLRGYINRGINTPRSIINRFAPSIENDVESYLNYICHVSNVLPDMKICFNTIEFYSLCAAICFYESNFVFTSFKYRDVCCRFNLCKPYNYLIH